ncbi:MAG: type II toxin-antitoxin system VapC family toxin [Burkholderiales bacterium]
MPAADVYLDTSALVKYYVAEPFSEDVERYVSSLVRPFISTLTIVEWNYALARRERMGALSRAYRTLAQREFNQQLTEGLFRVQSVDDSTFRLAVVLLDDTDPMPLRTLDALHLAAARACRVQLIATADRIMADASRHLGLDVRAFFRVDKDV